MSLQEKNCSPHWDPIDVFEVWKETSDSKAKQDKKSLPNLFLFCLLLPKILSAIIILDSPNLDYSG